MDAEERRLGTRSGAVPWFGEADSPYEFVRSFYDEWESFATSRPFAAADVFDVRQAADRAARRAMERANEKARADARRKLSETVRTLVRYVKRRDLRIAKHCEQAEKERAKAQVVAARARKERQAAIDQAYRQQRSEPVVRDEEAEEALDELLEEYAETSGGRAGGRRRREKKGRQKHASWQGASADGVAAEVAEEVTEEEVTEGGAELAAAAAPTPEVEEARSGIEEEERWAQMEGGMEEGVEGGMQEDIEEEMLDLFCPACNVRFNSVGQLRNHERSRKHLDRVRRLRAELEAEDRAYAAEVEKAEAEAEVEDLSVRELKQLLAAGRIDTREAIEKADLIELATQQKLQASVEEQMAPRRARRAAQKAAERQRRAAERGVEVGLSAAVGGSAAAKLGNWPAEEEGDEGGEPSASESEVADTERADLVRLARARPDPSGGEAPARTVVGAVETAEADRLYRTLLAADAFDDEVGGATAGVAAGVGGAGEAMGPQEVARSCLSELCVQGDLPSLAELVAQFDAEMLPAAPAAQLRLAELRVASQVASEEAGGDVGQAHTPPPPPKMSAKQKATARAAKKEAAAVAMTKAAAGDSDGSDSDGASRSARGKKKKGRR